MPATSKPTFTEKVNKLALEYCIENFKTLPIRQSVKEDPTTLPRLVEFYQRLDSKGTVKITYKQASGALDRGRWFAVGPSLQNMPREIRNTISDEYAYDIDIINCHPVFLLQICNKKGIECPQLQHYVSNRNELFSQLALNRDQCKKLTLAIMNGGTKEYNALTNKPTWLVNFYTEMRRILDTISKLDPVEFGKQKRRRVEANKDYNIEGSYVNCLLCHTENMLLECMAEYIESKGYTIGTYMFDGLTINKDKATTIPANLLKELCEYTKVKTGYVVEIIAKPMSEKITIPSNYGGEYKRWKSTFEERVCFIENITLFAVKQRECMEVDTKSENQLMIEFKPYKKFLNQWLEDPLRKTYREINFIPYPLTCPNYIYNTYKGLQIEKEEFDYDESKCKPILDLISVLMNHEKESIDFFTKWLAHLVKYPGRKNNVAIIIQSAEGIGKGLFWKVLQYILGSKYCLSTVDSSKDVFSDFNNLLEGKILINLNEAKEVDTSKYIEIIKSYITEDQIVLRVKNKNDRIINNYTNWLFFSNRDIPMRFQAKTQRRFWGINSDNSKACNMEFLKPIIDIVDTETKDTHALYCFYKYLVNIDIEGYDFCKNRPVTRFMSDIQDISSDNLSDFMDIIQEQEDTQFKETNKILLQSTEWYNRYKKFCKDNYQTDNMTHIIFSVRLGKLPGVTKRKLRTGQHYEYTPPVSTFNLT